MLAGVYSYRVMKKSVSSCCVRGRRVISNPVTFVHGLRSFTPPFQQQTCNAVHFNVLCSLGIVGPYIH